MDNNSNNPVNDFFNAEQTNLNSNNNFVESKTNSNKVLSKVLLLLGLIIVVVGCAFAIKKFFFTKTNEPKNDSRQEVIENKDEINVKKEDEILIKEEYFDVTNPIPVYNGKKVGYIDNHGNLIIDFKFKSGKDFIGKYAVAQEMDNTYHIIDRTGKNVMDIKNYITDTYAKYGLYIIDDYLYDIELEPIKNLSIYDDEGRMIQEKYENHANLIYDYKPAEVLEKFGYNIDGNILYYNGKKLMEIEYTKDAYGFLMSRMDTFNYDLTNYLIKHYNVFPLTITDNMGNKGKVLDLLSQKYIVEEFPIHMEMGDIYNSGLFIQFKARGMAMLKPIYSLFSKKELEITEDIVTTSIYKTYVIAENGGTITKETTKYTYYNSDLEKIYETKYFKTY